MQEMAVIRGVVVLVGTAITMALVMVMMILPTTNTQKFLHSGKCFTSHCIKEKITNQTCKVMDYSRQVNGKARAISLVNVYL